MKTISLTEAEISLLKESLLCAEINREKEGTHLRIRELHIEIDRQIYDKQTI